MILRFLVGCTVPLNGEEVVQQNTETESASFFACLEQICLLQI